MSRRRPKAALVRTPKPGLGYYLRDALTWGGVVSLVIGAAVTVFGVVVAASDVHGENPWGLGMAFGGTIAPAFTTLHLCWRATDDYRLQWAFRIYGVSGIAAIVNTIAALIAILVVPIEYSRTGFNYLLSGPALLLPAFVGLIAGAAASVVVFLVIVLPFLSVARSRRAIAGNLLSANPAFAARNRRAMIGLSVLLILVFLIPTLIVIGDPITVRVGVFLIPLGVFLAVFVSVTQRRLTITELLGVEEWQQTDRPVE